MQQLAGRNEYVELVVKYILSATVDWKTLIDPAVDPNIATAVMTQLEQGASIEGMKCEILELNCGWTPVIC